MSRKQNIRVKIHLEDLRRELCFHLQMTVGKCRLRACYTHTYYLDLLSNLYTFKEDIPWSHTNLELSMLTSP